MGIFGAMTTAISGLNAQSFALENISGNIANSRTTGFKRVETSFVDMVPDLPARRERSGSVSAFSRNTATITGDIQDSQIKTNMGISGEGFFVVRAKTGDSAGQPLFSGKQLYTRRGDFDVDRNGYLVNGAGYYLMGLPIDPITGVTTASQPQMLRISNNNLPARATTTIDYNANLPKIPQPTAYNASTPGSELITPAVDLPVVTYASEAAFIAQTIAGQSVTVYDAVGSPINVQMRWGKNSSVVPETWSLFYATNTSASPLPATPRWNRLANNVTFNAAGQMTIPASGIIATTFTVDGASTGAINLTFGATGLTQYASSQGVMQANRIAQDGYPTGTLEDISVADGGRVVGAYSNGQTVALAEVPLAQFAADNLMKRNDGGIFEETLDSGPALINSAGRSIVGAATEQSNADIADEFSKMIVTQQAYSANTRVVTTAQSMLQDVINIIR